MDLKARLCIELDGSVTAELAVASYHSSTKTHLVVWSQNFATFLTVSADHDIVCAKAALEEKVKEVKNSLGETIRIRTYKIVKDYEEIFEEDKEAKPTLEDL